MEGLFKKAFELSPLVFIIQSPLCSFCSKNGELSFCLCRSEQHLASCSFSGAKMRVYIATQ